MRKAAIFLFLLMLGMAHTSLAAGEEKFYPPRDYAYIPTDKTAIHESCGTGGTQPLLGNSLVPGSSQTYAQWWAEGDINDPERKRIQEIVDQWKQDAIRVWQLEKEYNPKDEIRFDEHVVGRLLSVRYERGLENGEAPCAVFDMADGRQLVLSDLFYDGFDYIDYINTFLSQKPDLCYHTYYNDAGPIEEMFKRPFAGLARDYPYFGVIYPSGVFEIDDPLPVMLQLLWTDNNPYWQTPMTDTGAGPEEDYCFVGVPLTHFASPYGECLTEVLYTPETWQDFTFYAPHVSIDQGRFPEAEKKINLVLEKMAASFREMHIPDAIDESGFGYYQIIPYIASRGQTLHVSLTVPTNNAYVTVFNGSFDLHTGERLTDIGLLIGGHSKLIKLTVPFQARQLSISQEEAKLRISNAWENKVLDRLYHGGIDLALTTIGKDGAMEQWAGAKAGQGMDSALDKTEDTWRDFDFIPIARDALVFVNRIENPVSAITQDQLSSIYNGYVSSWEEIGGNDQPLYALVPNRGTIAFCIFHQFVMEYEEGQKLEEGNWEHLYRLWYRGKESLGTLRWSERWNDGMTKQIRMLGVDGVAPSDQTVFDGSYPLSVTYYAVLKKGLPDDAPASRLVDWLLSDEGQRAIRAAGYASVR